jgi:hypothetical protein
LINQYFWKDHGVLIQPRPSNLDVCDGTRTFEGESYRSTLQSEVFSYFLPVEVLFTTHDNDVQTQQLMTF